MKKFLKRFLLVFFVVIIGAFIYSIIPRVWHKKSAWGTELVKASMLPDTTIASLRKYIEDPEQHYGRKQQVVALSGEEIVFEYGHTDKLVNCHSARKSIMSLLIGIASEKGMLQLDETLGELGIDESKAPLTAQEKTATIRHLLMAKSGVYLPAEAETDFAKANRPKREQYKPGEFFFYNNFDFNVLGAILEQKAKMSIGEFMEQYLAKPLGMQDFSASNVVYGNPWPMNEERSDYRVYWIFLSARDMARIGAMVAQQGKWGGQQVVSQAWIHESTAAYTNELHESMWPFDAYSYLWWLDKDNNTIWADGFGGQFLLVDTTNKLAVCQRNFTGNSLLSSGLFLMRNERHGGRIHAMHIYERILAINKQ